MSVWPSWRALLVAGSAGASTLACVHMTHAQDAPPSAWARAHDTGSATSSVPVAWLGAWSPLRPIGEVARGELRAPLGLGLIESPSPVAGAFVLAGAPGALARDLQPRMRGDSARFGTLRLQRARESGAFHRPFDMAESAAWQVSGGGWAPVGQRGVAIGRFTVDDERNATSTYSERISAGWSSPFIATDSVRPPLQRTRARLEGALGLRLGEFGVGLSAALDSREHNSIDFPLRRSGRWAMPAAMLGVERVFPGRVRVGGYYRWSEPSETHVLNPSPLVTVIYPLQGYDEPPGIAVGGSPYYVRYDRRATAVGGTIELSAFGGHMVLTHEQSRRADDQYVQFSVRVRPTDAWRMSGSETRAQIARDFAGGPRIMIVASDVQFGGEGRRSDLAGLAIQGDEAQQAVELDIRQRWTKWRAGVAGGAIRRAFSRQDFVAELRAQHTVQTPFVSTEVARLFGGSAVAIGTSWASRVPAGTVPNATERGPNYRRFLAPELAYETADASAWAVSLSWQQRLANRHWLLSLRHERASSQGVVVERLQPGGQRERWSATVGFR